MPAPSDTPALVARMIARGLVHPPPPGQRVSYQTALRQSRMENGYRRSARKGSVQQRILDHAAAGQPFTVADIGGNAGSVYQAIRMLVRGGRLQVVKPAQFGVAGGSAVYRLASS